MLIKAENEEIIGFVVNIFIISGISIRVRLPGPPNNPYDKAYNQILWSASMIVIDNVGSSIHIFLFALTEDSALLCCLQ